VPEVSPEQEAAIDRERKRVHRKYPRDHLDIDRVLRDALYADCHPGAIVQGLQRLIEYEADRPAAYLAKILRVESGNHHEADAIAQGDAWKQAGSGLTDLIRMARRAAEGGDGADPVG